MDIYEKEVIERLTRIEERLSSTEQYIQKVDKLEIDVICLQNSVDRFKSFNRLATTSIFSILTGLILFLIEHNI